MKHSRGFTLLEMMIVVAIIAIIATLATPSMRAFIQRGQVSEQMNDFAHFLQESRGKAVLLRNNSYPATIGTAVSGGQTATISDTGSSWSPNADRVTLTAGAGMVNTITYTLMGEAGQEVCYIMTHANNPTIGEVLILDRNGSTKIHKNKTDCIF
ncbi:MAG: prepilin-type N-terminal cleavage/methylation domain-containing protein [Moraxella sp.]|nr:prepilin-type N-terminal cleavage/methylation domain-containing protein [Moraxella sp.]